jgi:phosphoribosylglycinamide formyltransferase-1
VENRYVPLAILISGRGSNFAAIAKAIDDGRLPARIAVVISNRADAAGLAAARERGLETRVMPHGDYPSRDAYDRALADALREHDVRLICLAGFMRRLGPAFCDAFPDAILNIHPSLLPAFPGTDAQRQALEHGVKVSGATVHFVTPELDAGPIVMQATVPVEDGDTVETLSARILAVEHRLYPDAVARLLLDAWRIEGRRVVFGQPVTRLR